MAKSKNLLVDITCFWVLIAAIITVVSGLIYVTAQQNMRLGANDPQIQLAQDAARMLSNGVAPQYLVPQTGIDIGQSLSPFMAVFDNSGQAIVSSGLLNGKKPTLPVGVFDYVRENGEDRFTWQPQPDVRQAAVVAQYTYGSESGFVLAARSLKEVEKREDQLALQVFVAWVVALMLAFLGYQVELKNK